MRLSSDSGTSLVETVAALGVLGISLFAVLGAMTAGMTVVGVSRQRSAASTVAAERIERIRNLDYGQVALTSAPAHATDPDHPDYDVTDGSPPTYHVDGRDEPIVVDAANGAVAHVQDPVILGSTELYVYQYVTWVDDPGIAGTRDYKRATVVVTWRNPVRGGVSPRIRVSTFVGTGSVTVTGATPSPRPSPSPSPSPGPGSSPSPTPGGCAGDTTPPTGSISILAGAGAEAGYTNSTAVQVRLSASDPCTPLAGDLSNDGAGFTNVTSFGDNPTTVSWTITSGDGTKTVYARFRDGAGNQSGSVSAGIVLDQTLPSTPGRLRQSTCSISGNDRTVTLTWDASADTNLSGYRLYRSFNADPFVAVKTTSSLSVSDTTLKGYDSVRYKVRAYDRAGNESGDSNVLTYPKNRCL